MIQSFKDRNHFLEILSKMNTIIRGCEVGVYRGDYSRKILTEINSLEKLYLVDCWKHQESYDDLNNNTDEEFENHFQATLSNTNEWSSKVQILRGMSKDMVHQIEDNSLDFIYIDARHDYYGCYEDIESYWPKLKVGGIMSGHDYMEAHETSLHTEDQDWSLSQDGRQHFGAVKGAVDDFASMHNLQVVVSYREELWNTWCFIKK